MPDQEPIGVTAGEITSTPVISEQAPIETAPEISGGLDPFEGKSAVEIRTMLKEHPNPVVRDALQREAQSRSDELLQKRSAQTQQVGQLTSTLSQIREMDPVEFQSQVVKHLEGQVRKSDVSAEVMQAAQYQTMQQQVTDATADLGAMTEDEKRTVDPNSHGSYGEWRAAYNKVVADRAVAKDRASRQKEEQKAAAATARAEARNAAPTQDIDQGSVRAPAVDMSDLKGTGNLIEGLRRQRLAKQGAWPQSQ